MRLYLHWRMSSHGTFVKFGLYISTNVIPGVDDVLHLRNFGLVNTLLVHQCQAPYLKQELGPADPHRMNTVEEIFSISSSLTCVS
jgi:hypothetical protein